MPDKSTTRADVGVAELAGRQWGVVSLEQLRAAGLARSSVSERVRGGRLHRLHRGVYAVGHASLPWRGRFLAAVMACGPGSVASHFAAAAIHEILPWKPRPIDITVGAEARRRHRGIRVHRSSLGPHEVMRLGPLPATSVERTLIDLAAVLPYRPLRRAVREALGRELLTLPSLVAEVERLRPRRGIAKLRRIVATAAPTRSVLEDVVHDLILAAGFEPPDVNVPVVAGGRRYVPDFRWPRERVIVEADGRRWHGHKLAREDDAERQAVLEAAGERLVRVTWEQATLRRTQTVARIEAAGAPLSRGPRPVCAGRRGRARRRRRR